MDDDLERRSGEKPPGLTGEDVEPSGPQAQPALGEPADKPSRRFGVIDGGRPDNAPKRPREQRGLDGYPQDSPDPSPPSPSGPEAA